MCIYTCVYSGQRLSYDIQHISSSLLVDGAWSWLPGDASDGLSHGSWWPPCHHGLRVSPGLPVHRGVELRDSDSFGCTYPTHTLIQIIMQGTDTHPSAEAQLVSCHPIIFWSSLLLQLFGFVYACHVSKVFQDDEDSCESSPKSLSTLPFAPLLNKLDLSVSCSQKKANGCEHALFSPAWFMLSKTTTEDSLWVILARASVWEY